ncbi:MAG: prolyl oligopeptidase family serine peptidase, partial [Candidatus Aminicenantes bacterium]
QGKELVWGSERDGWSHLYLYDWNTGQLKKQITQGEFVVRRVVHVDEKKRQVYFTASGREPVEDPYLQHLYRVNPDGTGLTLLTPENAEHRIRLSPDKKYVVDTYSRVDFPPITVLRHLEDGKVVLKLEKADIRDLLAAGWKYPEAFTVKARDSKTDLYGAIFRPTNFNPNKKYPVIDSTYSGPHTVKTPKTFRRGCLNMEQAVAELGFIVVTIDGLGTAHRSKAFHDFSYKNLGDIGAPDHIGALKQLAQKYPYMDLSRVGIFGHSAGGYDAAHALLTHPGFYKVGVASAGNHDHQMAKAWWPEHFQGYPVGKYYEDQSNLILAKNLQGKLLLVHGDMDNNVNPASTLRLAGELIKANKDFDLIIIPNRKHRLWDHPYFIRKLWDYFVRHLLGVTPPTYQVSIYPKAS